MAVVTTVPTMTPISLPIIGVGENAFSPIPRSDVVYRSGTVAIAVATSSDTQALSMTITLPSSYAYVLRSMNAVVYGADAADWSTAAWGCFQDTSAAEPRSITYDLALPGVLVPKTPTGLVNGKVYTLETVPSKVVASIGSAGSQVCLWIRNDTADGTAMTFRAAIHLSVYDLSQAYAYAINTPTLVR